MASKRFDLGELIAAGKVPDLGAKREQIVYISADKIAADPENFYSLDGIDELASNIAMLGLQQPLRVRHGEDGTYIVVSGHRRREAILKLLKEGDKTLAEIPCIIEEEAGSDALRQLRLIMANSDTRKMTSADTARQARQVEELLYQLKEEGYEFPGRMRDYVAQICQVSKTKLANLKVIRDGLSDDWRPLYEAGKIAEDTALTIARAPADHQRLLYEWVVRPDGQLIPGSVYQYAAQARLDKLKELDASHVFKPDICPDGCDHLAGKWEVIRSQAWRDCEKMCCWDCYSLTSCEHACVKCAEHAEEIKREREEQNRAYEEARAAQQAERNARRAAEMEISRQAWINVGKLVSGGLIDLRDLAEASGYSCVELDADDMAELDKRFAGDRSLYEWGASTSFPDQPLEDCSFPDLVRTAHDWCVSTDYLLGASDDPLGYAQPAPADAWVTGRDPEESGLYFVLRGPLSGGCQLYYYNTETSGWEHAFARCPMSGIRAIAWCRCPEIPEGLAWNREVVDDEDHA